MKQTQKKSTPNLMNKMRDASNPYEIWGNSPSLPDWEWHVLKKWQGDDNKPYARWFCNVKTPIVPDGEMGDVYVNDIKVVALASLMCKGCKKSITPNSAFNALSRYGHGYICSECGTKEAFKGDFIKIN